MAVQVRTGMSASEAIELSAREGRAVHLAYTQGLARDLFLECESQVASPSLREYRGEAWRVCLHVEPCHTCDHVLLQQTTERAPHIESKIRRSVAAH